ncbi:hypothetical protein [Nocardiopsis alba]|uniref:hypothetical protein n=1 Tax=Nocardiopsis alba TaxID=53437 RepID=UPI0035DB402E
MPSLERLTRSMFSNIQPISMPRTLPRVPERLWSEDDWELLRLGYAAASMDEKWNVFAEDETVFLHRSWTGHGTFAATFAPVEGGGHRIVHAVAERDPERYKGTDDDHDSLMIEAVLGFVVLGEPAGDICSKLVDSKHRQLGSDDVPAGIILHSTLGPRSETGRGRRVEETG